MADSKLEQVQKILAKASPKKLSVSSDGHIILQDEETAKALRETQRTQGGVMPQDTNIQVGPFGCGQNLFC